MQRVVTRTLALTCDQAVERLGNAAESRGFLLERHGRSVRIVAPPSLWGWGYTSPTATTEVALAPQQGECQILATFEVRNLWFRNLYGIGAIVGSILVVIFWVTTGHHVDSQDYQTPGIDIFVVPVALVFGGMGFFRASMKIAERQLRQMEVLFASFERAI